MDKTKISVIVPVYNAEHYVERCLESIARQTYDGPLECVIVDDCGSDRSMEVVKAFTDTYDPDFYRGDMQWRIVGHDKHRGMAESRNTGLDAATGDYVMFVDAEDEFTYEALGTMEEIIGDHPGADVVTGQYWKYYREGEHREKLSATRYTSGKAAGAILLDRKKYVPSAENMLIRRALLIDKGLRFSSDARSIDGDFVIALSKIANSAGITGYPTYLHHYRK